MAVTWIYKDFLEVVKVNLQTKDSLQEVNNKKVNDEYYWWT